MSRRGLLLLIPVLAWLAPLEAGRQENGADIAQAIEELAQVTGLRARRPIRHETIRRDQVEGFLKDRVKEAIKPEQLRAEEITLKKFGFVPPDFNLEKATVELLTEQAAAFYDYRKRRLYLMEASPPDLHEMALVHEVAHALADQHFHLYRFIKEAGPSDDSALARLAVMEGQATWLTAEVLARRRGQSLLTNTMLRDMLSGAGGLSTAAYPVLASVPLYLRETLVFPYTRGMQFQHAVYEKEGGAAFARVFRSPPVSTQQVLHPEKYFAGIRPADPPLPDPPERNRYATLAEGMIGELDHEILLRQFASNTDAGEIAPRWRGGRYRVLERGTRTILCYAVAWDTPETALRYFGLYREALRRKWKHMRVEQETAEELVGEGDDGYFRVRLAGVTVSSLEGMPPPEGVGNLR